MQKKSNIWIRDLCLLWDRSTVSAGPPWTLTDPHGRLTPDSVITKFNPIVLMINLMIVLQAPWKSRRTGRHVGHKYT